MKGTQSKPRVRKDSLFVKRKKKALQALTHLELAMQYVIEADFHSSSENIDEQLHDVVRSLQGLCFTMNAYVKKAPRPKTTKEAVLSLLHYKKVIKLSHIVQALQEMNYTQSNSQNVCGVLLRLVKEGEIIRIKHGYYRRIYPYERDLYTVNLRKTRKYALSIHKDVKQRRTQEEE